MSNNFRTISRKSVTKHLRLSIAYIGPPLPVLSAYVCAAVPKTDKTADAYDITRSPALYFCGPNVI